MKYNYDKKVLKGLGTSEFLGLVKTRNAQIEKASEQMPKSIYNVNQLAASLHPAVQYGIITKIIEQPDAKSYVIGADKSKGTEKMAFFRAGQYVSIKLKIGDSIVRRAYTIASGPSEALEGHSTYTITVKSVKDGFVANWILENWKVGTEVEMSGPQGEFYYQRCRDAKNVIALAGGSGITPFYSMAKAIVSDDEDFELTILYGSRTADTILLKDELDEVVEASNGKVKVIHVLSAEEKEGYESGFLTKEIIQKYAPEGDYSIFVCGPKVMYEYEDEQLKPLGLTPRRYRKELSGEYGEPFKNTSYTYATEIKEYQLTVVIRGEEKVIPAKNNETLLESMERAGISAPNHCRSGVCGWCHSLLISGDVYIPEDADGRRAADKKFNWIHPCVTYPLSDIKIEVPAD